MVNELREGFGALFDSASLGIIALEPDGRIALANPLLEAMFGYAPGELRGQPLELLVPEDLRTVHAAHHDAFLAAPRMRPMGGGQAILGRRKNGQSFPIEASLSYIDLGGRIIPVAFVADITERKQLEQERDRLLLQERAARAEAEAAQRRQAFLVAASRLLASSLDYETTLMNLTQTAVPVLGDCCIVDLLVESQVQCVDVAHVVPEKEALMREIRRCYPLTLDTPNSLATVLRTGQPILLAEITEEMLVRAAADETHLRMYHEIGMKSALIVPLSLRERVLGALTLIISESERRYDGDDIALAQGLALLAAQAIENAQLVRTAQEARRHTEEALALLDTLVQSAPIGFAFLDHDLRYRLMNAHLAALDGLPPEAHLGRTVQEMIPEIAPQIEPLLRRVLDTGEPILDVEFSEQVPAAPGQIRHWLWRYYPVRMRGDEILGVGATVLDITALKQAEQALVAERALLAQRVTERTADLSAANAKLAHAARLKDEFLASMSHELRTPLNAVLGLSEALREEAYGPISDRQDRPLQMIAEKGRHLLDLINDILDLAKIGTGKMDLELEYVAVESICQASLRMVLQAAQKKQIAIQMLIDPQATHVLADARRLIQILVNLLTNAVKFTGAGGTIGLEVGCDADQAMLRFTVWDTGIGIPAEQLDRLFQPFVQLDSRLARQYEGTGLGLALVSRMTEMHGGSVAVSSAIGVGSRFSIALPWTAALAERSRPVRSPEAAPLHTAIRRALIIEDSPMATGQLARYLAELDILTETLLLGTNAVARAREAKPDLILLDILLPDTSSWEVLEQLKADPATCTIPVVIISVVDEPSRGHALGAARYLVKPCTRCDLQNALTHLSEKHMPTLIERANGQPGKPPPILLAEDNESNILTVTDYLAMLGYQVIVARNGTETIARAREVRPALILMNIQMPEMDGLEVTRQIRADGELAAVPIIAMTALTMPGDREKCLAAGADDYLSKPIGLKQLATLISAQLQRAQPIDGTPP
jgi:PAS domain S-box-containing protein